jgi:hypothetical protein
MQQSLAALIDRVWPQDRLRPADLNALANADAWEEVLDDLRLLTPKNESQRLIKGEVLQLSGELTRLRWGMIQRQHGSLPSAFLFVLIFWFTVLFAMFRLLAASNLTVNVVMLVCALSIAGGIFLTLEMNHPLQGLVKAPGTPLRRALEQLGN